MIENNLDAGVYIWCRDYVNFIYLGSGNTIFYDNDQSIEIEIDTFKENSNGNDI